MVTIVAQLISYRDLPLVVNFKRPSCFLKGSSYSSPTSLCYAFMEEI